MVRILFALALIAALAVGKVVYFPEGSARAVPIDAEIVMLIAQPERYDGKWVRVRGPVQDRAALFGAGLVRLGDARGSLVVAGLIAPPPPGENIEAVGVFKMAAAFGSFQAPMLLAK